MTNSRIPSARDSPWMGLLEIGVLTAMVGLMGWMIVPAHWASLWFDREFTGWVVPISNRLVDGHRLYEDGLHSPMPPVPFVLMRLLFGTEGRWIDESLINFLSQAVMIAAMFVGFSRYLPRPIPFLTILSAIPVVFAFPKTILYDGLTQAIAAIMMVAAVAYVVPTGAKRSHARPIGSVEGPSGPMGWLGLMGLATLTALCVLSKQSTGVGAAGGMILVLRFFPRADPRGRRIARAIVFVGMTALAFALLLAALSPWANPRGLIEDVFLTGSQPKGGTGRVAEMLFAIMYTLVRMIVRLGVPLLLFMILFNLPSIKETGLARTFFDSAAKARERRRAGGWSSIPRILPLSLSLIAAAGIFYVVLVRGYLPQPGQFGLSEMRLYFGELFLEIGLVLALAFLGASLISLQPATRVRVRHLYALGAFMLVALPTAMTHSLSVHDFRWTHDNNPLILVALAALGVTAFYYLRPRMARSLAAKTLFWGLFGLCQVSLWGGFSTQLAAIAQCTETWPEIEYLDGARLRKTAAPMRDLVLIARRLAPDAEHDEVLLLPGDPNVEAWFDRPRPALSSAIVFADQYWRRTVEEDLKRLEENPPKVIIIGPRDFWRWFHIGWTINSGTESLIDKIEAFMLRDRYIRVTEHPIIYKGQLEYMDVYLRKPDTNPVS